MAVFKCKMCGANLELKGTESVCICNFCGTYQTLPRFDDDRKIALFTRANNLRIKSEFDKAEGIYESIVTEFRDEAEAYWGLVLCKYGVEYVDDGKGRRVPTCHRTLPVSIMEDDDFQQACEYASLEAKNIYREEAKVVDSIQRKILNIALNEDPYDIFICYKETDDITGNRTEDSIIAQDIYTRLIKSGYKVFFARDSLKSIAGAEYEPYIYAALSSSKLMLAIGTKHEYYDSVWVKNEWSRFISMMNDNTSKVLIPCYRNMDAYDMPKEFKNMQALDMGDVTFFGSLTDNINRILKKSTPDKTAGIVSDNKTNDVSPLLERGFMFVEDENWDKADEFFEAVLNKDPRNVNAYLGKLLGDLHVTGVDKLSELALPFFGNANYEKIMRFADDELKSKLENYNHIIELRNEENRQKDIYENALEMMANATTEEMFENTGYLFLEVKDYKDAKAKADECFERGEVARVYAENTAKDKSYNYACSVIAASYKWRGKEGDINALRDASITLQHLGEWRDSKSKYLECVQRIEDLERQYESFRAFEKQQAEQIRVMNQQRADENKKLIRKILAIAIPVVSVFIVFAIILATFNIPALLSGGDGEDSSKNTSKKPFGVLKQEFVLTKGTIDCGDNCTVAVKADGTVVGVGNGVGDVYLWSDIEKISSGSNHTVGLKSDGTVVAVGSDYDGECDVEDWSDIIEVSAGDSYTVGLKKDGTVVATKYLGDKDYYYGECDVENWTDIIAISAGREHTVGIKKDGTCVATDCSINEDSYCSGQCKVDGWKDIVDISIGYNHTVGLKKDGTVVIAGGYEGDDKCDVSDWSNIVAVAAGDNHTVGLKGDGTVVAVGDQHYGQCDVEDWTDIVAVSAGSNHTIGLKADGTLVATEYKGDMEYYYGECDVNAWTDIVSISTNPESFSPLTVGVKKDGTVVSCGDHMGNQSDIKSWTDIKSVAVGQHYSVGLKNDGTVVATGIVESDYYEDYGQCNVDDWTNIIAVSVSEDHTVGLKKDGTLVAVGNNENGQCNVGSLTDIVAISAGKGYTMCLHKNGSVVGAGMDFGDTWIADDLKNITAISSNRGNMAGVTNDGKAIVVGEKSYGQCDVDEWSGLTDISCGNSFTVGLKNDGTVVATEYNGDKKYYDGQCEVGGWRDVVDISAGYNYTVGLKSDGTVVAVGSNSYGACNVGSFTDLKVEK